MSIITFLSSLVKGKALVTAAIGVALVGGTGAALAATPASHTLVQNIAATHATASPTQESGQKDAHPATATVAANKHGQHTPGPGVTECSRQNSFYFFFHVACSSMEEEVM